DGADGGLTTRSRPFGQNVDFANAMFHGPARGLFGRLLSRVRGALAGAFEPEVAGAGPGEDVAVQIADGDDRVVERRFDVGHPVGDIFAFFPARAAGGPRLRLRHYLRTFFLPAIVFFGPLRVRALVWVR